MRGSGSNKNGNYSRQNRCRDLLRTGSVGSMWKMGALCNATPIDLWSHTACDAATVISGNVTSPQVAVHISLTSSNRSAPALASASSFSLLKVHNV